MIASILMMKSVMLMSLWDNSLEGELFSLGQCMFFYLSDGTLNITFLLY